MANTLLTWTNIHDAWKAYTDDVRADVTDANFLRWVNYIDRRSYDVLKKEDPERYLAEQYIQVVAWTPDYSLVATFWTIDADWAGLYHVDWNIKASNKWIPRRQKGSKQEWFYIQWRSTISLTPQPASDLTGDYLEYDNESWTFTKGLVVTWWTSWATWTITTLRDDWTTWYMQLTGITWTFQDNEEITDTDTWTADVVWVLHTPRILRYIPTHTKLATLAADSVLFEEYEEYSVYVIDAIYQAFRERPEQALADEKVIRALDDLLDNFRSESYQSAFLDTSYAY